MLSAKQVIDAYRPLHIESQSRAVRRTKLRVISHSPANPKEASHLTPAGSVSVVLGRKGSTSLREVQSGIEVGGAAMDKVLKHIAAQSSARREISIDDAAKQISQQSVFADIQYGGATLAQWLALPKDNDYAILVFPYNGGHLAPEGFSLVEYYQDGTKDSLEAVAFVTSPSLTAAEKAALDAVPADQLVRNVGQSMSCDTTAAAVAWAVAIVVLVVVALATAGCVAAVDVHISEVEIQKLGPAASARKLLNLRREALNSLMR